jgi:hypothetical protein
MNRGCRVLRDRQWRVAPPSFVDRSRYVWPKAFIAVTTSKTSRGSQSAMITTPTATCRPTPIRLQNTGRTWVMSGRHDRQHATTSGWSNSCRVGYLPPTGSNGPFTAHDALTLTEDLLMADSAAGLRPRLLPDIFLPPN